MVISFSKALGIVVLAATASLAAQSTPVSTAAQETGLPTGISLPGQPGVSVPTMVSQVQPKYTQEAMRARLQGTVILSIVVLADGTVGPIKVLKSLDPGLDQNAIEAAKQWKFRPGTKDGTAVPVLVSLQIVFRLSDGPPPPPSPAPFTWPEGFSPELDTSVPGPGWTDDVEETDTVKLRLSFPSFWTLHKGSSGSEWLTLTMRDGLGFLVIGIVKPSRMPFVLAPLPQALLDQMGPGLSRLPSFAGSEVHKVGQAKAGDQFWLWLDLSRPLDVSTVPPEVQQLISAARTDLHAVAFITSAGMESVTVVSTLIMPKDVSAETADAEFRKAGADVIAVVSRMKIEVR